MSTNFGDQLGPNVFAFAGRTRPEFRNRLAQYLNTVASDDPMRQKMEQTLIYLTKQERGAKMD